MAVLASAVLAPRLAGAQAIGYGIAGPAGVSGYFVAPAVHAAAGGAFLVRGRAGVTAEFGVFGNTTGGLFVTSVDAILEVPTGSHAPVRPYVSAGYSRLSSGDGPFDAWNAGGGVDVWAKPRLGVRLEYRDHVRPDVRGPVHYWALRAGIVFR